MTMWFRVLAERLRGLFARKKSDGELEAELCAHLEMHAEENMRRGMSPDEARLAAKKEFGGVEQAMETYRDARGLPFLETFVQDLRYGVHGLVKTPGFALIAILTLALGIGATSAVFSVVDRILFRTLSYPQDDRLVSFGYMAPLDSNEFFLGTDYVVWRARQVPFAAITSMTPGVTNCDLTNQSPVRLSCAHVEYTLLPTLSIQPILGRNF